jgi:hypothetical protein
MTTIKGLERWPEGQLCPRELLPLQIRGQQSMKQVFSCLAANG